MFRQESESMKLALEYCPNFNTSLHVPRIQNERQNMHRRTNGFLYALKYYYCEAYQVFYQRSLWGAVVMEMASWAWHTLLPKCKQQKPQYIAALDTVRCISCFLWVKNGHWLCKLLNSVFNKMQESEIFLLITQRLHRQRSTIISAGSN